VRTRNAKKHILKYRYGWLIDSLPHIIDTRIPTSVAFVNKNFYHHITPRRIVFSLKLDRSIKKYFDLCDIFDEYVRKIMKKKYLLQR